MNRIKVPGVPIWISFYTLLLFAFGTILGILSLIDASNALNFVEGADALAKGWAGRTLGLGLGAGVAIGLRSKQALTIVLIGALGREFGDVLGALPSGNVGMIVGLLMFLLADAIGLFFCVRSIKNND